MLLLITGQTEKQWTAGLNYIGLEFSLQLSPRTLEIIQN